MSLDHAFEHVANGEWLPLASEVIRDRKDGSEVV